MWLLIKLAVPFVAFFVRLSKKTINWNFKGETKAIGNLEYRITVSTNKKGTVTDTSFYVPFDCKAVFKLTKEGYADYMFKSMGVADELQTQHAEFDTKIYIASDDYSFRQEVQHDVKTRELIMQLFAMDCEYISCDGATLTAAFDGDKKESHEVLHTFHSLRLQIADMKQSGGMFADKYAMRILAAEAVIWSLAGYAATCYAEYTFEKDDMHFEKLTLVWYGLCAGFTVAMAVFFFVVLFLKGSSRGHRILVESFVVLVLALPVGGVGFIADINKNLDESKPVFVRAKVVRLYQQQHRGHKGRTYYTNHMVHEPESKIPGHPIPQSVELSISTYRSLQGVENVEFEVGMGWLNLPWFRSIKPSTSGEY